MEPAKIESAPVKAQPRSTVLVVDDEESFHEVIARYLEDFRVLDVYNGWQALDALAKHHVDVVLLDLNLPDTTGLKLLDKIKAHSDDVEVIVITAHSEVRNAVQAVKQGAFDFLAKSYENYQQLGEHIGRALHHRHHRRREVDARTRLSWMRDAFALMERSGAAQMRKVVGLARQVASTPLTVLLEGESGVGKEVLARFLHAKSDRANAGFVAINLTAVPATLIDSHLFGHVKGAFTGADKTHVGKFELADGGTIFLDEIGELDAGAQCKLLRVLQEREVERLGAREAAPVDVRVIAATNKNLQEEVAAGRFREDLFYRLNVVRMRLPPLRERTQDLPGLLELLVAKHSLIMGSEALTFTDEALSVLVENDWPGNIRELENLVMRLVAINPGKGIVADDIPTEYSLRSLHKLAEEAALRPSAEEGRLYFLARDRFERYLVRLMVKRCGGDRHATAEALGVSLSTVKEKLRDTK